MIAVGMARPRSSQARHGNLSTPDSSPTLDARNGVLEARVAGLV